MYNTGQVQKVLSKQFGCWSIKGPVLKHEGIKLCYIKLELIISDLIFTTALIFIHKNCYSEIITVIMIMTIIIYLILLFLLLARVLAHPAAHAPTKHPWREVSSGREGSGSSPAMGSSWARGTGRTAWTRGSGRAGSTTHEPGALKTVKRILMSFYREVCRHDMSKFVICFWKIFQSRFELKMMLTRIDLWLNKNFVRWVLEYSGNCFTNCFELLKSS